MWNVERAYRSPIGCLSKNNIASRPYRQSILSKNDISGLGRLPVERQRRFAEGEAIEVARDGALQTLELAVDAGIDADRQRIRAGIEGHQPVARPVGAAGVLGKGHGAMVGGGFDREVVLPMLAQLLEVFAGLPGGD